MNFMTVLLLHFSCAFRIEVPKETDQNLVKKENQIANEIKKLDEQTKYSISSINKDDDIMMQKKNQSVINDAPDFKRQISVINEKRVCCSDKDHHKYDIDNAANTKSHRCISISHKFPLRFESKIFSRSIQEAQKPEVEKIHVAEEDEDVLDDAISADDEHKDILVGDTSILSPNILVIGDNVDVDTENAKFRRQVTKTKQICCGNGENGNDGDFKKNSRINLIHKVSPKYQNKMFSKTALESAPSQVFVTNDLFKEVQFLMNDY